MGLSETRMTLIVLMGALCWNRIEVIEIIGGHHPVPGKLESRPLSEGETNRDITFAIGTHTTGQVNCRLIIPAA